MAEAQAPVQALVYVITRIEVVFYIESDSLELIRVFNVQDSASWVIRLLNSEAHLQAQAYPCLSVVTS